MYVYLPSVRRLIHVYEYLRPCIGYGMPLQRCSLMSRFCTQLIAWKRNQLRSIDDKPQDAMQYRYTKEVKIIVYHQDYLKASLAM